MDLPADLIEVAEGIWSALGVLAGADPDDATSRTTLDALGERYAAVMRRSQAIAHDTMIAFARVRVQVKVMEIAPDSEAATPSIGATSAGSEPEAVGGVDATSESVRPTPSASRVARRRMRRAFRRWVKWPLVRTA